MHKEAWRLQYKIYVVKCATVSSLNDRITMHLSGRLHLYLELVILLPETFLVCFFMLFFRQPLPPLPKPTPEETLITCWKNIAQIITLGLAFKECTYKYTYTVGFLPLRQLETT